MTTVSLFACVQCGSSLDLHPTTATCTRCEADFPLIGAAPDLLLEVEHSHHPDEDERTIEDDFVPQRKPRGPLSKHIGAGTVHTMGETLLDHRQAIGRSLDVLDLGCGARLDSRRGRGSRYVSMLGQVTGTYRGIDPSAWCVEASSRSEGGLATFEAGEVARAAGECIPLPAASIDAVLIISALDHCAEPMQVLEECRRVLRPNGVVIIHSANRHHWAMGLARRIAPKAMGARDASDHHIAFTPAGLADLVASAGLDGGQVRESGHVSLPPQGRAIEKLVATAGRALGRQRFLRLLERVDAWAARRFPGHGSNVLVIAHNGAG